MIKITLITSTRIHLNWINYSIIYRRFQIYWQEVFIYRFTSHTIGHLNHVLQCSGSQPCLACIHLDNFLWTNGPVLNFLWPHDTYRLFWAVLNYNYTYISSLTSVSCPHLSISATSHSSTCHPPSEGKRQVVNLWEDSPLAVESQRRKEQRKERGRIKVWNTKTNENTIFHIQRFLNYIQQMPYTTITGDTTRW